MNSITSIVDDMYDVLDNGTVVPIPADALATTSLVSSSTLELTSPLPTEGIIDSDLENNENKRELPWLLDYGSQLIHLAVFGILGVLTRYLLRKLFGPGVMGLTSDQTVLYLDLPSNMVGSFLMGWFGIVFKGDLSRVSDYLAIGLATGYLGSLTTFSGWNQKLLDLSVQGKWALVVFGYPIGFILADYAIICGVRTAEGFKRILETANVLPLHELSSSQNNWKVDNFKCRFAFMFVLVLMLGLLWGVSGVLERREFDSGDSGAHLWLACIVGPFGVWLRWFLARRLNGHGLPLYGVLKWVPFGTLIANVAAACLMAALGTLMNVVNTRTCNTIATAIQFGLLGSLSTVSSFVAEVYQLRESSKSWRGDVYALVTIVVSFGLGTLIYSVPVWTQGYEYRETMSSSSNNRQDDPDFGIICFCGKATLFKTAGPSAKNPGRRYFKCMQGCGFYCWYDPERTQRGDGFMPMRVYPKSKCVGGVEQCSSSVSMSTMTETESEKVQNLEMKVEAMQKKIDGLLWIAGVVFLSCLMWYMFRG